MEQLKSLWNCKSSEALKSDWATEYLTNREILWNEIYLLNWNVFFFETIRASAKDVGKIIAENFYQTTISTIYKLVLDQTDDALTLKRFKNRLITELKFPQHVDELQNHLRSIEFDKNFERLDLLYRNERHGRIAHLKPQEPGISIFTSEELLRREEAENNLPLARDLINSLYDSIRLNGISTAFILNPNQSKLFSEDTRERFQKLVGIMNQERFL